MSCACVWPAKWRNRPKPRLFSCVCVCVFPKQFFLKALTWCYTQLPHKIQGKEKRATFQCPVYFIIARRFQSRRSEWFFRVFLAGNATGCAFFFFFLHVRTRHFFFLSRAFLAITRKILRFPPPSFFLWIKKNHTLRISCVYECFLF